MNKYNIGNTTEFKNNYARAAAYFITTCADAPRNSENIPAYELITGIYGEIYENAEALGIKTVPDAPFRPFEQQKGREKDVKNIRTPIAKIEEYISRLYQIVINSEASPNGLTMPEGVAPGGLLKKLLEARGVTVCAESDGRKTLILPKDCAEGLKRLAQISAAHITHITDGAKEDKAYLYFSRCVFEPDENWTAPLFDRLLNADGRIIELCKRLEERGYSRIECRDGKKVSLDYVKQHGKKQETVKQAWGERTHSGIEISYEELVSTPCYLWIRMPMFATVLESEDKLPTDAVEFIKKHTKKCDGCRYCVQTDKTGERKLATKIFGGEKKCPYYPGFTMNTRKADEYFINGTSALLDAIDKLLDG